ncbi:ABC1 kinase family protein [Anaeromyxobacter paludicola]|uniref:2-octaprenylphenol hydroxylase n=1 Tax=Anaeromyxobacter paludicola TaxID=2918171 RepID=A0ABN6N726_9BACT|nr:AarF/UbiB family protein [Anaeromyxobacter paludicola]BDG07648.1 2-octaprenylphenol hydroxylase [Anaeromyxobacter paludicola]
MLREAFQDLNRLRQIAQIVARHGFGAYLDRTRLGELLRREGVPVPVVEGAGGPGEPVPPPEDEPGRKTAARFRRLLVDLGPTFIKLGQLLSSRPDILPSHWVDELSELQDAVPAIPLSEVRAEIERGLKRRVEDCFASLEEAPLASASIAQVHRATTHEGAQVVVKVQRPHIRQRIEADLQLLYTLAQLVESVIEETGIYTPTGIVEEFDRAIHEELDFANEAENARQMAEASRARAYVVIPKVHDALSSSTVLTLDYVEGVKLSEVTAEAGYDVEAVARTIIEVAFRQLFEDGLFHGDPHPGNILVLPGNRIALLDFGLVGRLTRPMQESLVTLIMAVALRDPNTVARVLNRIGVPADHTPITAFRADIGAILDRYLGLKLEEIRTSTLLRDLLDLAVKHKIRIPKEYAVLSKASVTVEGIIRRLYPRLDILEVGMPYARELLLSRFNPTDASGTLMKSLLKLQGLAEDLPAQLSQILMDLESGKFRVNVRSESLDRIAENVSTLSLTLFLGLVASGLSVAAFLVFSRALAGWPGLPLVAGAALVLSGVLFGGGLVLWLSSRPRRKISVRRLFKH